MKTTLALLLALPALSWGATGNTSVQSSLDATVLTDAASPPGQVSTPGAPPNLRQKIGRYLLESGQRWDFGLEAGIQSLNVGGRTFVAPAVGLRIRLLRALSSGLGMTRQDSLSPQPGARSDVDRWSVELGAATPHDAPGDFRTASQAGDNAAYAARVKSLYEVHLAAIREWLLTSVSRFWSRVSGSDNEKRETRNVPLSLTAGFGVSMMHIINRIESDTNTSYQFMGQTFIFQIHNEYETRHYTFSPLLKVEGRRGRC